MLAGFFPGIPNGGVNTPIANEKHLQGSEAETPPLGVRVSNSGRLLRRNLRLGGVEKHLGGV